MIGYAGIFIVGNLALFQNGGNAAVGIFGCRGFIGINVVRSFNLNFLFWCFDYIFIVGNILNIYIVTNIPVNYRLSFIKVEFLPFRVVKFALYTYFVKFIAYNASRIFVFGRIRFNLVYFNVYPESPGVASLYERHLGKRILHKISAVRVKVVYTEIVSAGDRSSRRVARKHIREEEYPLMTARLFRNETEKSAFGTLYVVFVVAALIGNNVETELRSVFTLEHEA